VHRFVAGLVALVFLSTASTALAAGPSYVAVGGLGIKSHDGKNRFVAVSTGGGTAIARIAVRNAAVRGWATLDGEWGIPQPTFSATRLEGLTRDGKRLIVGTIGAASPSQFAVIDTQNLRVSERFALDGRFAYDALSPDGKTLYLTQYVDADNAGRYVVRAYDLEQQRLLPGRVAEKAQRGWVMEGFAVTRATSADGRWAYTLFMRPGGYPFVHALDTVKGAAHCIGLPWRAGQQDALLNMRMTLAKGEDALVLHWKSGKQWLSVDTATWKITHPTLSSSFPWRWVVISVMGLLGLLVVAGAIGRRRFVRHAEEALPQAL
jgi:hypothetical protein